MRAMRRTILWPFLLLALPLPGTDYVYLSEIMYDSPLNERVTVRPYSNGEYVRLYNAGSEAADLQGWKLLGEGKTETFVLPDVTLPARSSLVIAYRSSSSPEFELSDVFPAMADTAHTPIVYQDKVVLANTKETIRLLDAQGMLRDSVYYGNVTSIQPIADRLVAENEDSIPGSECLSVQRRRVELGEAGRAVANHLDWEVAPVPDGASDLAIKVAVPSPASLSGGHNYVVAVKPTAATGSVYIGGDGIGVEDGGALVDIQYYDGFGRPSQLVQAGASPTGADLVTRTEQDAFGRELRRWLPVPMAGNGGGYVPGTASTAADYYDDAKPYAETAWEQSPVDRPLGVKHPGSAWHAHPTAVEYGTNATGEVKLLWDAYAANGADAFGCYGPGTLHKTRRTDEDGNVSYEYHDMEGRLVLARQVCDGMDHDTYYAYDGYGNLACVLPPLLADHVEGTHLYDPDNDPVVERYAYCYEYDQRNRCTSKKKPGCGWTYMVYDKADRLVLAQDPNQREKGQWTINKYDIFGRLVYSGYSQRELSQQEIDMVKNNVIVEHFVSGETFSLIDGYTCNMLYHAMNDIGIVNYYDNYDFLMVLEQNLKDYMTHWNDTYGEYYEDATGLQTGSKIYYRDDAGNKRFLVTAYFYDNRGRLKQERSSNHIGGYDVTTYFYDFAGNVVRKAVQFDDLNTLAITETYAYTYDHAGRLLKTTYQLDNNPEIVLSENTYDETGKLAVKKLHNGTDTVRYKYNIRDWVTEIQDGDFKESLYYCGNGSIALYGATNLYNGNVSSATYTSGGKSHTYAYTYDGLNRLKAAKNHAGAGIVIRGSDAVSYNEEFTYDKHGNIITLQRNTQGKQNTLSQYDPETGKISPVIISYSAVPFDKLSLEYDGNRLVAVTDEMEEDAVYNRKEYHDLNQEGNDFGYDANGNLIYDLDRDIVTVRYNQLNLPDTIQFRDGRQIVNRYAADGRKLTSMGYTPLETMLAQGIH